MMDPDQAREEALEELKASREELETMNEELMAVNHELNNKVDELGQANSDLQNLMDATAIATVFLDGKLCITRFTPSAAPLFNLINTDVGRPLTDLKTHLHYPELAKDAARVLEKLVAIEREVGSRDGSWYLARLLPYRTIQNRVAGVVLSFINITERKQAEEMRERAEEAVRESEERLRLLIENATEFAIFSMDLQRRVTVWNAGAERLLGFHGDEIIGKTGDVIFTPEDRAQNVPDKEVSTALAEGRAGDDRYHLRKDGSRFWASGAVMLMRDDKGEAVGFVKILRDQTAARESREALERSRTELLGVLAENEKARAELQAADVAKDQFLAVLSHELRNPLASIYSAAELMLTRAMPDADSQAAAEVVRRQARAMKAMLDGLIDVSRLKLGRLELKRERVRLSTVVNSALEINRPLLADAPHSLKVDLGQQDIELDADQLRLVEVVSNLLSNAIKYTPRGGTIAVKARVVDDQLELSVKDTGIGMEPRRIPAMFEMFAQEDPRDDPTHGLGVGLALVRNIVELHGGQISARSDGLGKGSEFRVVFPSATSVSPGTHAAKRTPMTLEPTAVNGNRGLVLIADDNADAGWSMAKLLEMAGFETVRVSGGREAVHEIERRRPRAGVIDIGMPDLNGHEVARQVRATPWGQQMVLIAATGWGQAADQRQALEAGFDAHMTKPVNPSQLSETLDALLSSKASPK